MESATRQFRLVPSALPAAERRIGNTLPIPGWLYLLFVLTCGLKVLAVIGPLLRH